MAPGPPWKSVSPVKTVPSSGEYRHTAPGACPGVCSTSSRTSATASREPVLQLAVRRRPGMRHPPQRQVVRVQQDRGPGAGGQLGGGVDVVVVRVRAHDRGQPAAAERALDRVRVVRGVDHQRLGVVTDDPDVVVHLPLAAVQREDARGDEPFDPARPSQDHHRAQHVAAPHRGERLLDVVQRDRLADERVQVQPALAGRGRSASGKSRDGRQSPYQEDFSEPPRPKTSSSGSSSVISGVGTPTSTTVPARSRA